ncbi:MAG: C2H2-type zinc finger protein [Zetaproteobacteria bacterium]|nr:C2H2-type zinc finger protein [Zetaproteobacteria bacterium]
MRRFKSRLWICLGWWLVMGLLQAKPFRCAQCGTEFTRQENLNAHVRAEHEGRRYSCAKCNQMFRRRDYLRDHVRAKHEHKFYSCKYCGQEFRRRNHLSGHIRMVHRGQWHSCVQCGGRFPYPSHLREHLRSVHQQERYVCEYCKVGYSRRRDCERHSKVCKHKLHVEQAQQRKSIVPILPRPFVVDPLLPLQALLQAAAVARKELAGPHPCKKMRISYLLNNAEDQSSR